MCFTILELYCKEILNTTAWDLIGIRQDSWCKCKKGKLSAKHFKLICASLNITDTFDEEMLSHYIFNLYWEQKNEQ
jgi:hypothetical protein